MNKLVCMMIVKNEADKYLSQVIENTLKFCDELVILNDHSDDDTVDICKSFGDRIFIKNAINDWSNEYLLRDELLQFALARNPTYLIAIDADELYDSECFIKDYKYIIDNDIKLISFYFYNCWNSENSYRDDKYFGVGTGIRMCKADLLTDYSWQKSRRHCGSLPSSIFSNDTYVSKSKVKHLGYMKLKDRQKKYKEKIEDDPNFEFYSKETYDAILDSDPNLVEFKK